MVTTNTRVDALLLWAASALRSSERILSGHKSTPGADPKSPPTRLTQEIDAAQMLLALRNALRAAEWLRTDRHLGRQAKPLIAEFKRRTLDVAGARNVLEHFDQYAEGRGRQYQSTPGPYRFAFSGERAEAVVTVGPFSIDVVRTREACRWLVIGLMAVFEFEGGMRMAEAFLDDFEENG